MRQALAGLDPADVRAIGVSGQQHGMVVLGEGNEVRACQLPNCPCFIRPDPLQRLNSAWA